MKTLITILVLLVIIIGGIFIFNREEMKEDSMTEKEDSMMMEEDDESMMMKDEEEKMMMKEEVGVYEDYDVNKLNRANDGDVVLFFKADWCPTCNSLDKDIISNLKNIPSKVSILKVDYDNSAELKQKYGITYQHTFVQVDSNGNQIAKWSGSSTLSDLLTNIK